MSKADSNRGHPIKEVRTARSTATDLQITETCPFGGCLLTGCCVDLVDYFRQVRQILRRMLDQSDSERYIGTHDRRLRYGSLFIQPDFVDPGQSCLIISI